MKKKVVITGATGLIGMNICSQLIKRGDDVTVFTRSPERAEKKIPAAFNYVKWQYDQLSDECKESLNMADAVIHLAGESIMSKRWNEEHKKKVYDSRIIGTRNIVNAIKENENKPGAFVCASAVGYYDNDINKEFDEHAEPGQGFLQQVTIDWEKEAAKVETAGVRRVSIRIGIVLDKNEGALAQMMLPYKFFIGGPIGSGEQWLQWIHVSDIANLFIYAVDNELHGAYNGVSENITMNGFAKTIGEVMHRPSIFRVPSFVLKVVLGETAEAVLKGSKIIPVRTKEAGYKFKYTSLKEALEEIINYSNHDTIS